METLGIQYVQGEKLHSSVVRANKNGAVSNGEDVVTESWWADVRDIGFEYKYMNNALHVKGPKGNFIPYSDIPKTFLTKQSSNNIASDFQKSVDHDKINFRTDYDATEGNKVVRREYEKGGSLHAEKNKYDELMNQNIAGTMIQLQNDNGGINDAFKSFAVDQRLRLPDGSGHTTFAQYYMSNSDLYGEADTKVVTYMQDGKEITSTLGDFAVAFKNQNLGASPELINKQINIIFNDIIENANDPDIMEDMRTFLTAMYGNR